MNESMETLFCCLDASAACHLELVQNARNSKSNHSLYGILNHTKTAGGGKTNYLINLLYLLLLFFFLLFFGTFNQLAVILKLC